MLSSSLASALCKVNVLPAGCIILYGLSQHQMTGLWWPSTAKSLKSFQSEKTTHINMGKPCVNSVEIHGTFNWRLDKAEYIGKVWAMRSFFPEGNWGQVLCKDDRKEEVCLSHEKGECGLKEKEIAKGTYKGPVVMKMALSRGTKEFPTPLQTCTVTSFFQPTLLEGEACK